MQFQLSTMFHKSTLRSSKSEQKAFNKEQLNKWLKHNERDYNEVKLDNNFLHSKIDQWRSWDNVTLNNSKNLWEEEFYKENEQLINKQIELSESENKKEKRKSEVLEAQLNTKWKDFEIKRQKTSRVNDYEKWFNSFFKSAISDYNSKQNKECRKIKDGALAHYENKKNVAIAEQILVGLGSEKEFQNLNKIQSNQFRNDWKDFWKSYQVEVVDELQKIIPEFKIYQSTLHLDESVPHLHVIGVPIVQNENQKNGLKVRVSNSQVFTPTRLNKIHEQLREFNQAYSQELSKVLEHNNIYWDITNEKYIQITNSKQLDNADLKLEKITFESNLENKEFKQIKNDSLKQFIEQDSQNLVSKQDKELFKSYLDQQAINGNDFVLVMKADYDNLKQQAERNSSLEDDLKEIAPLLSEKLEDELDELNREIRLNLDNEKALKEAKEKMQKVNSLLDNQAVKFIEYNGENNWYYVYKDFEENQDKINDLESEELKKNIGFEL